MASNYEKLVKSLRCNALSKQCDSCKYGYHLCPDSECNDACNVEQVYADAAAAIEDLEGFLSEAERDRDEYEERMRKEQERVIVLQAEVKRLQNKLCDWCAVCPKERRKPEDCELLGENPVMYVPSGAKMEVQDEQ